MNMEHRAPMLVGMPTDHVRFCNGRIVGIMSMYLNLMAGTVTTDILEDIVSSFGIPRTRAYGECVAAACEIGADRSEREFVSEYIYPMIHEMDPSEFENDPYFNSVKFSERTLEKWEMKFMELAPCEAFVCNDFKVCADGFLYNMVRIMTGTLVDTAYGKIEPCQIKEITESHDRRKAGATAPACGLYLNRVVYN